MLKGFTFMRPESMAHCRAPPEEWQEREIEREGGVRGRGRRSEGWEREGRRDRQSSNVAEGEKVKSRQNSLS
jgi:hypothetical protein